MSIRSEEVNYLIYRYLQESGFQHTAFAFAYESMVADTKVYDEYLPPGSLITYLQQALQYTELEAHVCEDGSEIDCSEQFSLIYPHKCNVRRKDSQKENAIGIEKGSMDIPHTHVKMLEGHTKGVYSCEWSPTLDILATGSADSTVRLWNDQGLTASNIETAEIKSGPILSHSILPTSHNDVTSINWSSDGSRLLSASYSGEVIMWSESGSKLSSIASYGRPVFNVSFSPDSSLALISGALPSFSVIRVDDINNIKEEMDIININELEKQKGGQLLSMNCGRIVELSFLAVILDSLWKDNISFALVNSLNQIITVNLQPTDVQHALLIHSGHEGEIGSIDWTMDRSLLISGADDGTIRLWNDQQIDCVKEYLSHTAEVNQVLATNFSSSHFYSCSNDKTVKLFSIESNTAVCSWRKHETAVTHLAQSRGDFCHLFASGGIDRYVYFYDSRTREVVRNYRCPGHVYDIAFNRTGDKCCIATVDSQVYVLDLHV